MKTRSIVTFSLLAVILLVGCAPAPASAPAEPEAPPQPAAPVVEEPAAPTPTQAEAPVIPTEAAPTDAPTEAAAEVPQPVATSRGPGLHSTNPANVSLASGELQLVEFFRYT